MRLILFILALLGASPALAMYPCLPAPGNFVRCLPSAGFLLTNQQATRYSELTSNGSDYVAIQAPASLTAPYTLTLPPDDGTASQFLQTNGSGALTWSSISTSITLDQQAWVAKNGNDGTGVVGDISKPFLTVGAAEAAITDATFTKAYLINISPGDYDVTGVTKKANIYWQGSGQFATTFSTSDASPFDLADPVMATDQTAQGFNNLGFNAALDGDFKSLGGLGSTLWVVFNTLTKNNVVLRGRGGDRDSLIATASDFDDGWELHSVNAQTNTLRFAGTVSFKCTASDGGQWLGVANLILAAVVVQDEDNGTFCLIGMTGSIVGGSGFTIDGANAQAYLDANTVISNNIIQLNGGILSLLAQANRVSYTPTDSANWSVVPGTVAAALDAIAGGTVRPPSWTVVGAISATTSVTDTGTAAAILSATSATTIDGSNTTIGIQAVANGLIDVGTTNDKSVSGFVATSGRTGMTDEGTLHDMTGGQALMFMQSGAGGVTEQSHGFSVENLLFQGTVTDSYDFYSHVVPAGGIVVNHYGLYIDSGSPGTTTNYGIYIPSMGDMNYFGGSVGIGTSIPSESLEIASGNIAIPNSSASAGAIIQDNDPIFHTGGSRNIFAGATAGNPAYTNQADNVGVGFHSLGVLTAGASRRRNTAIGSKALENADDVGTTVSIGYLSGSSLVSGGDDTIIGAGADIDDGMTNSTAIGAGATVTASNSMVLGDGSVNVGIGTTAPVSKLEVISPDPVTTANIVNSNDTSANGLEVTLSDASNSGAAISAYTAGVGPSLSLLNTSGVAQLVNAPNVSPGDSAVEIEVAGGGAAMSLKETTGAGRQLTLINTNGEDIGIKIPPSAVTPYDVTLPATAGTAGQFITTDGSGTLGFSGPVRVTSTSAAATCSASCSGNGLVTGGGCSHSAALANQVNTASSDTAWTCTYLVYVSGNCTATAICTQ